MDIVEKKLRSDIISVGLYGFKNTKDFLIAYMHLSDKHYPIEKLYPSHIISYLIGYRRSVFKCSEICNYEDFSSDEAWAVLQKKYAVCFINLDTFLEDAEMEYNTLNSPSSSRKNGQSKICCIAYTAGSYFDTLEVERLFEKVGMKCLGVVTNVPKSDSKIFINNVRDLKNAIIGV